MSGMTTTFLIELAGWLGAVFYVLAYLLLTLGKLSSQGIPFHLLNILGALGLIVHSLYSGSLPSLAVNVVWMGIGLAAIARRNRDQ